VIVGLNSSKAVLFYFTNIIIKGTLRKLSIIDQHLLLTTAASIIDQAFPQHDVDYFCNLLLVANKLTMCIVARVGKFIVFVYQAPL